MASNKLSDVKFVAITRLTDRKIILALNPHQGKSQYNSEVSKDSVEAKALLPVLN